MSRTYKDRPYRLAQREAMDHGYVSLHGWTDDPTRLFLADVGTYVRSRHNVRCHLPLRRYEDWRWIEGDWESDYGNERRIAQHLHMACREANSGLMDDDWDDPVVYQRRRRWWC